MKHKMLSKSNRPLTLTEKILEKHRVAGKLIPGEELALRIDQTLTQDATGTLAFLEFIQIGIPRVKTKLSVSYVDHNTLQTGFENADDHRFLQSAAARYGVYFSPAGNGICHQLHLERFAQPGETLLGSDSHTPTAGAMAMFAIGAGGLDVAAAMAGYPFYLPMPEIVRVELSGRLQPGVSAKDIILELLRRLSVKGGIQKVFEYAGPGITHLTVSERATITNMGTELGATSSIFPADAQTNDFLRRQGRGKRIISLQPDPGAKYQQMITLDISRLEPLIACPDSPDNVRLVSELSGTAVQQVCIGSCTNSSYSDLVKTARILEGKKVHPSVSLVVNPGTRALLEQLSRQGYLAIMLAAGARILEPACGPCIGMGQAPPTQGVSLRSYNRNFPGRSGTKEAKVYLASPEVCAYSAVNGVISDPHRSPALGHRIILPKKFLPVDRPIISPPSAAQAARIQLIMGPNIKTLPELPPLPEKIEGSILLRLGSNISTDQIMPAGANILSLRSNIPALSRFAFVNLAPDFAKQAEKKKGGFIVAGENYGQGSSREHAALVPRYLGIKAVLAISFARIHQANLINFGILPLIISREVYELLSLGDELLFPDIRKALEQGREKIIFKIWFNNPERMTQDSRIKMANQDLSARLSLTRRMRMFILAGGLLNYLKSVKG